MSEPHILIEREYTWDEFCDLLKRDQRLIRIYQKYNDNYTSCRNYDYSDHDIDFLENKVEFFNASNVDYHFERKFNEKILYGYGSFYPVMCIFDKEETGEEEEYEGNNGMYYKRKIKKTLDTYKLHQRELQIYQLEKL